MCSSIFKGILKASLSDPLRCEYFTDCILYCDAIPVYCKGKEETHVTLLKRVLNSLASGGGSLKLEEVEVFKTSTVSRNWDFF